MLTLFDSYSALYGTHPFLSFSGVMHLVLFLQPRPDDEEGWKKFCLGEKLYLDTTVQESSDENNGIDYVQVGDIFGQNNHTCS